MPSPLARRLFGLAAGSLALLTIAGAADAKPAAKKDDDQADSKDSKDAKKSDGDADAKDKASDADADSKDAKKSDGDADAKDKSSDADADSKDAKKPAPSKNDAFEEDGKDYYFVGLRYRHTILPKFLIGLFVDGGPTVVSIPGFGLEVSKRRDGFEMVGALTYQNWGMDPFPFKGKNESEYAWEIAESHIKMLNATADFLWSSKLSGQELQFQYGLTAGLGLVWGDLIHQQAHPGSGGAGDPSSFQVCQPSEATSGQWAGNYCNPGDNQRWAGYKEPSWAGGGYKPIIYPTFGLQLGLRWKPAKQFVGRLDVGYNLFSGFFFGLGADYGI